MSEAFIGEIRSFAFGGTPTGWSLCDGRVLSKARNAALFSLIGYTYGGSGDAFNLPDLRGRVPVGRGEMPGGGTYVQGTPGGEEATTLQTAHMPAHRHRWNATNDMAEVASPTGGMIAVAKIGTFPTGLFAAPEAGGAQVELAGDSIGASIGGRAPHENMQPYLATTYHICVYGGVFPTRD